MKRDNTLAGQKSRELVLKCVMMSDFVISVLKSVRCALISTTQVKMPMCTRSLQWASSYGRWLPLSEQTFPFPVVARTLPRICIAG